MVAYLVSRLFWKCMIMLKKSRIFIIPYYFFHRCRFLIICSILKNLANLVWKLRLIWCTSLARFSLQHSFLFRSKVETCTLYVYGMKVLKSFNFMNFTIKLKLHLMTSYQRFCVFAHMEEVLRDSLFALGGKSDSVSEN